MTVRRVIRYPHPILRAKCKVVDDINDDIEELVRDLTDTMNEYSHCVGLAAPQIGIDKRVFVVDVSKKIGVKKNHGFMALINPIVNYRDGERVVREGCLSIPEFVGEVIRSKRIIVNALSMDGEEIEIPAKGLESVAIQHELDHLDGVLFIDRVSSLGRELIRRKG